MRCNEDTMNTWGVVNTQQTRGSDNVSLDFEAYISWREVTKYQQIQWRKWHLSYPLENAHGRKPHQSLPDIATAASTLDWVGKTPSDLTYISHQLLLYISSHAMQNKTPESPFSDLVSPVSLSKKNGDVMQQLNGFFPLNFSPVFLGQLHCLLRSQIQCIAGCTQQGHCIQTQGAWKQLLKGLEKPTQEQHKTYMIQTASPKINIVMASFPQTVLALHHMEGRMTEWGNLRNRDSKTTTSRLTLTL